MALNMLTLQVALILAVIPALASSGDRSNEFQSCLSSCSFSNCASGVAPYSQTFISRITHWTCIDECKYSCMHVITDGGLRFGAPLHQYYGKWPFWRFAGMQEPASVVFSLLNLWCHVLGAKRIRAKVPDGHPMKRYYVMWAAVSINAWVWSSVFHTRDLPLTEKLDYFSAALAILYAIYYTVVRFFHLYQPTRFVSTSHKSRPIYVLWSLVCVLVYISHVSYLVSLPRFDYSYNMAFNLVLGLSHNILWLLYSLPSWLPFLRRFPFRPRSYRPSYASKAAIFVVLTTLATALELFDFFPWGRIIDAHSLWHLSTAPITGFWYDFLIEDALDEGWREIKTRC